MPRIKSIKIEKDQRWGVGLDGKLIGPLDKGKPKVFTGHDSDSDGTTLALTRRRLNREADNDQENAYLTAKRGGIANTPMSEEIYTVPYTLFEILHQDSTQP